jgi:hypothetical protein
MLHNLTLTALFYLTIKIEWDNFNLYIFLDIYINRRQLVNDVKLILFK